MRAFYNEIDRDAANWLRELIRMGIIPEGDVDERSIVDIDPEDLRGYTQCHFFAGIGVWAYALRQAGWPDDRPVWTGSCPCQPFSSAGKRGGVDDERHLWPAWNRLIRACRPDVIFGEQVGSSEAIGKVGRKDDQQPADPDEWSWLCHVQDDLEDARYAFGAAAFPACSVGAPHIRQRLYFVAERVGDPGITARKRDTRGVPGTQAQEHGARVGVNGYEPVGPSDAGDSVDRMADNSSARSTAGVPEASRGHEGVAEVTGDDGNRRVGPREGRPATDGMVGGPGPTNGFWSDADWLFCRDDKWRPVESGTFPLVDGSADGVGRGGGIGQEARVMRLRGYGNAIVAEQAVAWIRSYVGE